MRYDIKIILWFAGVQPKLVAGFVNSGEVTTDAIISSEVTTVSSFGGQSGESLGVVSVEPTTTTTTTTTTEAAQLDKFGRQRGGPRFGGRTRKPIGGGSGSGATTTTEAPATVSFHENIQYDFLWREI